MTFKMYREGWDEEPRLGSRNQGGLPYCAGVRDETKLPLPSWLYEGARIPRRPDRW